MDEYAHPEWCHPTPKTIHKIDVAVFTFGIRAAQIILPEPLLAI